MSGNLPDGCTQADIDRHCEGEPCRRHGIERSMDGSCDSCDEELMDESSLDEPQDIEFELLDYWAEHSELFRWPDSFEIGHIAEGGIE